MQEKNTAEKIKNKETPESKVAEEREWKIKIPAIELEAPIQEGTTEEILNQYVGHFEETAKINGNIGLAAHNRGYAVNYFQNVKNLKEEDEIKYTYKGIEKTYKVKEITIISSTDWSKLQETQENTITLITCVENKPEQRRCIQAVEE